VIHHDVKAAGAGEQREVSGGWMSSIEMRLKDRYLDSNRVVRFTRSVKCHALIACPSEIFVRVILLSNQRRKTRRSQTRAIGTISRSVSHCKQPPGNVAGAGTGAAGGRSRSRCQRRPFHQFEVSVLEEGIVGRNMLWLLGTMAYWADAYTCKCADQTSFNTFLATL
jgi:hypothetical protein